MISKHHFKNMIESIPASFDFTWAINELKSFKIFIDCLDFNITPYPVGGDSRILRTYYYSYINSKIISTKSIKQDPVVIDWHNNEKSSLWVSVYHIILEDFDCGVELRSEIYNIIDIVINDLMIKKSQFES